MADSLSIQTYDGSRNWAIKAVDVSDGTGLNAQVIATATNFTPNLSGHSKIRRIRFSVTGMNVRLQWAGVTAGDIAYLSPGEDILDWSATYAGGFPNNAVTPNGNIIVTTSGQVAGSGFTLEIEGVKGA